MKHTNKLLNSALFSVKLCSSLVFNQWIMCRSEKSLFGCASYYCFVLKDPFTTHYHLIRKGFFTKFWFIRMSTYPIFLRTVSLLSICVHRENVYVRHDSCDPIYELILWRMTSGLQFSVEQAMSNCFAFYWHTETNVFWRTYNTLSIEVTALSISSEESSLHRKLPDIISFICC